MNETFEVPGVEIFAAGEWNGDPYTVEDLDLMVNSFIETKDALKPYLKLGHSKAQNLLKADELPAAGWITNLYRKGSKLIADFTKVPKKIYELIKAGGYSRVSSEIFINAKINGKIYAKALKAVALLGGETPAVSTLDDIHALYIVDQTVRAYENDNETRVYEINSQEAEQMNTVEELQKGLAQATEKLVEMTSKHSEAVSKVSGLEKEIVELKAKNEKLAKEFSVAQEAISKIAHEKRQGEINAKIAALVSDKKIMPAQKDLLFSLLDNSQGERSFKIGEKEYKSVEELVLAFVESGNASGLNTDTNTQTGIDQGDLASRAKNYQEKNKVSYKEALIAVSREAK